MIIFSKNRCVINATAAPLIRENNDLSITHPIGSHYSQIVFHPTGLKSKSDKSKVYPSCVSWWHVPHSEKIAWRLIVKVEILGSLFAQNTTLIIISHVIKIITKGFMHNTDY